VPDECQSTGVYFLSGKSFLSGKRIIWSHCAFQIATGKTIVPSHHSGRSSENFEFLCVRRSSKDLKKNIRFCNKIKQPGAPICLQLKYDSKPKIVQLSSKKNQSLGHI
jgi:hypothetical protein